MPDIISKWKEKQRMLQELESQRIYFPVAGVRGYHIVENGKILCGAKFKHKPT